MYLKDICELAKELEDIYIVGHINPDGDCIGSTLALALLLEKKGVLTKILLKDIPSLYDFLPVRGWLYDKKPDKVDLLITLDCGDLSRLGEYQSLAEKANKIINIDHHMSNTGFGHYNFINDKASSTCEIIYDMVEEKDLIDSEIAKSLYTGIIYDTGVFKHSNTNKNTHQIAGCLIEEGFDFTEIINKIFFSKSLTGLRVQSKAIENIQLFSKDRIVVSYLTKNELELLNATKKHTESIVQVLNEIENVECSVFIYETELNNLRISLRSKDIIDVCKIAKKYGGGGHKKASGFSYYGHLSIIIQKIVDDINEQLN